MQTAKKKYECAVFEQLAPLTGLAVVPGSILQPLPPAPDIECTLADGSILAAELVALDHQYTQTRIRNTIDTKSCWYDALGLWSAEQRQQLIDHTKDLVLFCGFSNTAGRKDRREVFRRVQQVLLNHLPSRFAGNLVPLIGSKMELPGLRHIRAERRGTTGVKISAPTAGRLLEPDYTKLQEKLTAKRYTTSASLLHLFAYSDHDELDGHVDSLARLEAIAREHLRASPFTAVHFCDYGFGRHLLTVS